MALHATDNVGDALEAARELLLPFDRGTWLRLALVSLFVGGVGGAGSSFQTGTTPSTDGLEFGGGAGIGEVLPLLVAVVLVALAVGAVFAFVGSVMEFVLVAALSTRTVRVRSRFREHLGDGVRLFAFRAALLVVGAVFVAGPVLLVWLGALSWLFLLVAVPFMLVAGVVLGVLHGFTNVFVVPVMYADDCGLLEAWRRFLPVARAEPGEYLVYLVLSVILSMIGGVGVSIVVGLVAIVVLIPLVIVGALTVFAGGFSPLALVVLVPLVLLAVVLMAAIYAVVSVPVVVYLRYYALLELGDTSEYDLIPELRAEIRDE